MQKRTRNEWKKILTGVKEILDIDIKTRDINSTEKIKEAVKNIAFQYARDNKEDDIHYNAELKFLKSQIVELKKQVEKYRDMAEETTKSNNILLDIYKNQKNKSWFKKIWG